MASTAARVSIAAKVWERRGPGNARGEWFEGNCQEFEADLRRRRGQDADTPHRMRFKKLAHA